jgi:maleylpyruvate isomerase
VNSQQREHVIQSVAASHAGLLGDLVGLTDEQARQPSLLPDWTVGHVLTHIARNADGLARMMEGALAGEVREMYPGGREAREADIEAGSGRPAAELIADVTASSRRVDELFASCPDEVWATGQGRMIPGDRSIEDLPQFRQAEVEIHRVDLGLGYTFADLPRQFLRSEIARMTAILASRKAMGSPDLPAGALALSEPDRLAWLAGRLVVEGMPPSGVY